MRALLLAALLALGACAGSQGPPPESGYVVYYPTPVSVLRVENRAWADAAVYSEHTGQRLVSCVSQTVCNVRLPAPVVRGADTNGRLTLRYRLLAQPGVQRLSVNWVRGVALWRLVISPHPQHSALYE